MSHSILCPNCNFQIEVSEALTTQVREQMRKEFDAESRRHDHEVAEKDHELRQRERALELSRQSLGEELERRVAAEREQLSQDAQTKAKAAIELEMRDLLAQLSETKKKLGETQKEELQLRRQRQELEDQKVELELTLNRRLDEERKRIREVARQEVVEENRLRQADEEKLIGDLRAQIDDLKRRSEQGTPQARGEVAELMLEELLRDSFAHDAIQPVPVSYHGGDVLHLVHDPNARPCGTILWESKRTRNWNEGWLPKLRDDQRAAKAHVAVLVTTEMPKGITTFGYIDGVWVTSRGCLLGLAVALRFGMIEAARSKRVAEGDQTKAELLHRYLSSSEFRQRIEGIAEALVAMKEDLDSEKRSHQRIWAKREKQLDRAMLNTSGLYGDLGGIMGPSIPQIDCFELAAIASGEESTALEAVGADADESRF